MQDITMQTGSLSDSLNHYGDNLDETIRNTEQLGEAGTSTSENIAALEEVIRRCGLAAGILSAEVEKANENEQKLSQAMQEASQISEQLADNDRVSTEARENLTRASQEAEEAINELTLAQQSAEEAMTEYDRIIASGTNNIEELRQAAERVSQTSEELDNANRRAADATNELSEATRRAADEAENGSQRGANAIEELEKALAAAGIAKLISEIKDAFMEASAAAAEFETGSKKISTIADTTQVSLSQMSSDIMNLSRDTGIFAADLEEATYSALSASVNTADAVEFTATASKLATGGFTSSATAVDVLTTALNAYGLEAGKASNISDMLIQTQNLGKCFAPLFRRWIGEKRVKIGRLMTTQ